MRLESIAISGFRGFREPVWIPFGSGFTVITGRNGVGKSTVCDAIEFALTGELAKYAVTSAARETIKDYIWWRGEGLPSAQYVALAFRNDDGTTFKITRTRDGGADQGDEAIIAALCRGAAPDEPLKQLCKTSILRDEWIAALSLDLTEMERFDLVRAALGSLEDGALAAKAKAVVDAAQANVRRIEATYNEGRAALSRVLVELSEISEVASRSPDISAAMSALNDFVPESAADDVAERIDRARRQIVDRRRHIAAMEVAVFQGREIAQVRAQLDSPEERERRELLEAELAHAREVHQTAQATFAAAKAAYDIEARANETAKWVSSLVEHGEKLGLHEGHCPLCDAIRSPNEFAEGLAEARRRIDALASGVSVAQAVMSAAHEALFEAQQQLGRIDFEWEALTAALRSLHEREKARADFFEAHGLPSEMAEDVEALERKALGGRDQLVEVERALNALDSSKAVSRWASVDARVATSRREVDDIAAELARSHQALAAAKALERNLKRSASEIVDERLAQISPLLNELYQRLRPHADWRNIDYSIRGDVRRFLSLKVGNELNPQFVFSSGQRRAAGLAFLLSVHLARSWSNWDTLVLDDPIQHIDDFRALHLVEVLAALRNSGRQILCAVEDDALADLLCRRLLSSDEQPGRKITIDTDDSGSARIAEINEIAPMASRALSGPDKALVG